MIKANLCAARKRDEVRGGRIGLDDGELIVIQIGNR